MRRSYDRAQLPQRGNIRHRVPQLILTGFPWLLLRAARCLQLWEVLLQSIFLTDCNAFSWLPSLKSLKPVLLCFEIWWIRHTEKKKLGINYRVYLNFECWKLTAFSLGDLLSQSEAKCLPASSNYLSAANAFTWDISDSLYISRKRPNFS